MARLPQTLKVPRKAGKAICAPEYTITRTCRRFSYNDDFLGKLIQEWGARGSKLFRPHIFDSGQLAAATGQV